MGSRHSGNSTPGNGRVRRRNRGISTAEILAATTLSLTTAGTVFTFQEAQLKAMSVQSGYAQSQNVTRTVIDLVSRELRMASYDPTNLALPTSGDPLWCVGAKQGIVEATPTRVRFRQDLNADGAINGPGEDVTYDLSGTQIRRTDGNTPPLALVDNVAPTGLAFRYFSASTLPVEFIPAGVPASLTQGQRDCIARVQVTVRANVARPTNVQGRPITSLAGSEIAIRNRSLVNF
jgi:hypothetical protein